MRTKPGVMGLVGILLVTGCQQKPDSSAAKVATLEARIAIVETNLVALSKTMEASAEAQKRSLDLLQAKQDAYQDQLDKVSAAMLEALSKASGSQSFQSPAAKGGIPPSVYQRFQSEAEKLYPNDYIKQTDAIQTMLASYRKSISLTR